MIFLKEFGISKNSSEIVITGKNLNVVRLSYTSHYTLSPIFMFSFYYWAIKKSFQPLVLNPNLCAEVQKFHCYMRSKFNDTGKIKFSYIDLHNTILKDGIQCVFPNVQIAQCIFLTLFITNCSEEHSSSQLKRIKKNSWRKANCQDRLDSLSLLCKVSFDALIQNFAITISGGISYFSIHVLF